MRIHELLFEARIYNQDYLDTAIMLFSSFLPQKAQEFIKRIIIKAAQDPRNQLKPKLKPDATEWDKKDLTNGTLVSVDFNTIILDKLRHIKYWLRHPDITEQELNSLIGIQNIDIAYEHADRFFAKLNKKASDDEDESGLEIIMTWPDGFKLVKLKTEQCLNREGKLMQHCVGSYANEIQRGTEILSLRDPQNNPHVTIEKRGNNIHQIKGKQNEAPIEKYHKYIVDYLNKNNFDEIRDLHYLELIKVNDKIYELNNLPDNFTVDGGLDLSYTNLIKLPENLTITGSLSIMGCPIKELPKGLKINGSLYASRTKLESLPNDLELPADIDISYTNIKELPKSWEGKIIKGYLNIAKCQIKELPENLTVNILNIRDTPITKLPDSLKVKGLIKSTDLKLEYVPKHLRSKIK